MGRPQAPFDRDGSPMREFAFWLRDLRSQSAMTYKQLSTSTHFAPSTLQEATRGERLPTLKVTQAFVRACGGDVRAWTEYWTRIKRLLDPDAPTDMPRRVTPDWLAPDARDEHETSTPGTEDGWYFESFTALLLLDAEPIQAVEQRVVVATADGITELATTICVPRHPGDPGDAHELEVELLYGGSLDLREQPFESFFRNVITLPEPLRAGDRHEYSLRTRIPAGQKMVPHYVHVPLRRSDLFDMRVRFDRAHMPEAIWKLDGVPNTVFYERQPNAELLTPDKFGEVHVSFRNLTQGLGYGVRWSDPHEPGA